MAESPRGGGAAADDPEAFDLLIPPPATAAAQRDEKLGFRVLPVPKSGHAVKNTVTPEEFARGDGRVPVPAFNTGCADTLADWLASWCNECFLMYSCVYLTCLGPISYLVSAVLGQLLHTSMWHIFLVAGAIGGFVWIATLAVHVARRAPVPPGGGYPPRKYRTTWAEVLIVDSDSDSD